MFKILDRRRDIAIQYAVNMFARIRDLGVAVPGQIFHFVDKVILRGVRHILNLNRDFFVGVKLRFRNRHSRRFRIVDRGAGYLVGICFGGGRRGNRVRQLVGLHLQQVGVENDLAATAVVIVLGSDVVDRDRAENRDDRHALVNHRVCGDIGFSALSDPLLKDLAGHEGVLRHNADGLAGRTVILGELLFYGSVIIEDHEADIVLIRESGLQLEVGCNAFAALVLGLARKPADEVLALHNRCGGKGQRITTIVGVGLVDVGPDNKLNGEDILVILCPNGKRSVRFRFLIDMDIVAENTASVHPPAIITVLYRHLRNVIQAVAGVCSDRPGGNDIRLFSIRIECDRIGDLVVIRDNLCIGSGNE